MKNWFRRSTFVAIFAIAIASFLWFSFIAVSEHEFNLRIVVIDPGHGGRDPGNISPWETQEKEITLAVSLKLAELLRSKTDYQVFLTRTKDEFVSLSDRTLFANHESFPPDQTFFISIHCNAFKDRTIEGVESYIFDLEASDEEAHEIVRHENASDHFDPIEFVMSHLHNRGTERYSWEAARLIQKSLTSRLKCKDRNLRSPDKKVKRGPFFVLSKTNMPAILIELGFLSNPSEHRKLISAKYQKQIAESILLGIKNFDLHAVKK